MIKILLIVVGVICYVVILYFLIKRTLQMFNINRKAVFWVLSAIIFTLPIFSIINYHHRGILFVEICSTAGFIITGFLIYYILSMFAVLFIRFIIALITKKNKFVYDRLSVIISAICSIIICSLGIILAQTPISTSYDIDLEGEHNLKIVALSDIHYGASGSLLSLSKMVDSINKENADIVFLVGDVFDNYIGNLNHEEFANAMNRIESRLGVYAVTGNHEFKLNTLEEIKSFYKGTQVKLLLDEEITIENISFIGRIDYAHGRKSLDEIKKTNDLPIIVLDHQPQYYRDALNIDADLQISGHTHNGQIFPGDIIVFFYNLLWFKSPSNGVSHFDDFTLAITRGYGTWGFPMRLTGASQILIYNIK